MLSFGRIKDDDDDDAPESFDHINSKLNVQRFNLRCLATTQLFRQTLRPTSTLTRKLTSTVGDKGYSKISVSKSTINRSINR